MSLFKEDAPAKINLSLHVAPLGRDGYHTLHSLVMFADYGDRLHFAPAQDLRVDVEGPFGDGLDGGPDNLIVRAAQALRNACAMQKGAHITLHKALPVASGIGGGSADAAAALRGLNRLWDCGLDFAQLEALGAALGSDVPVCVQSRARLMSGRGEVLNDGPHWPVLHGVLVNPGCAVSTAQVFSRFDALGHGTASDGMSFSDAKSVKAAISQLQKTSNALTPAACAEAPAIAILLDALAAYPQAKLARLCGSGATCLALVEGQQEAADLAAVLHQVHPKHWVQAVELR